MEEMDSSATTFPSANLSWHFLQRFLKITPKYLLNTTMVGTRGGERSIMEIYYLPEMKARADILGLRMNMKMRVVEACTKDLRKTLIFRLI